MSIGFGQNEWDIQLSQSSLDCVSGVVCYELELKDTGGGSWTLGDQNYRLFYDGDLMSIISVSSLLTSSFYSTAIISQNLIITGQGQEAASPLDDIDDTLGFLDFSIIQTNKSNPPAATQLSSSFIPIAEICLEADPVAINDVNGLNCLAFYHSRPSTAGSITNQYTVISENDVPNNTVPTDGINFDDLNSTDGVMACIGVTCSSILPIELITFEGHYEKGI